MNLIDVAPGPVRVLPQECTLCSGLPKSKWEQGLPGNSVSVVRMTVMMMRFGAGIGLGPAIILRCVVLGEGRGVKQNNNKVVNEAHTPGYIEVMHTSSADEISL